MLLFDSELAEEGLDLKNEQTAGVVLEYEPISVLEVGMMVVKGSQKERQGLH